MFMRDYYFVIYSKDLPLLYVCLFNTCNSGWSETTRL